MYKETCKQILQNILKIAYIFLERGRDTSVQKTRRKRTLLFSQKSKGHFRPPKSTSDLKKTLQYVSF